MNIKAPRQQVITPDTALKDHKSEAGKNMAETSRIAIFNGWILSMLGIVAYCLAMLGSIPEYSPYSTLFERGWIGSAAASLLIVGVSLWVYGTVTFLRDMRVDDSRESDTHPF